MDPLSHVLSLLRPQEVGWNLIEGHNAWSIRFPARPDIVVFGHMLSGDCEVSRQGISVGRACTGDFFLMACPPAWSMQALAGGPSVDLKALFADPTAIQIAGTPKVVTRFVGGYFSFATASADLLARLMLPVVHVRAAEVAASRLGGLMEMLGQEAVGDRVGRGHVLERLLELILVEALRQPDIGWSQAEPGILKGLADPKIAKALRRFHEDAVRPWTVAELAQAAGMSRSAFALRFVEVVGQTPIEYLSSWRMTVARQALETRSKPLSDIAELAGYQSVSAFSTAFRRLTGKAPTAYLQTLSLQV
ncbi:MAG: cupin domain-containing protein [Caulobacteraceae bacterium]